MCFRLYLKSSFSWKPSSCWSRGPATFTFHLAPWQPPAWSPGFHWGPSSVCSQHSIQSDPVETEIRSGCSFARNPLMSSHFTWGISHSYLHRIQLLISLTSIILPIGHWTTLLSTGHTRCFLSSGTFHGTFHCSMGCSCPSRLHI